MELLLIAVTYPIPLFIVGYLLWDWYRDTREREEVQRIAEARRREAP